MSTKKLPCAFAPLASSTISGSRLRLDLDLTARSSDSSGRNKIAKNLDFVYNDYLQALMKKHIISTKILCFENLLQQQINYQQLEMSKMSKEYEKKKTVLQEVVESNEIVNILHSLQDQFRDFEKTVEYRNVDQLISLSNILGTACRQLKLVDVKQLSSETEWLLLLKVMNECSKFIQNFFQSHKLLKEYKLIDEISETFKETSELERSIQEQMAISSTISKKNSVKYLDKIKSMFDMMCIS